MTPNKRPRLPVLRIAAELAAGVAPSAGFCDQAECTRQFARSRRETPARFRRGRRTQSANPKVRIDP
ncbi:MAG: hypothetical protein GY929_01810 [Actinomycetia bacterium]|nr:hypothetical protein [Actinomycetes bacterium]